MKIKYSIIVPVYNTENYLDECLQSLLNQSFSNYEVLLVNDGSTDNSEFICKKYCRLSDSFKLINQTNSGVSVARNVGISEAKGEYLMFVDSDDYIHKDTLMFVDTYVDDNDLIIFGHEEIYKNCSIKKNLSKNISDFNDIKDKIIVSHLGGFLCNKVFKKSIIKNNNLCLDNNMNYCEDLLFTLEYLSYCKKAFYIASDFYKYRMRKSGASYSFYNKKSLSIFKAYNFIINYFPDDNVCSNFVKTMYIFNYYRLKKFVNKYDNEVNNDIMNKEKEIIRNSSKSMRIKILMCKHFLPIFKILQRIKHYKYKLYK